MPTRIRKTVFPSLAHSCKWPPHYSAPYVSYPHSYFLLFPFLFLLTKSPSSSLQTVLHVLFLPSPLKRARAVLDAAVNPDSTASANDPEEKGRDGETAKNAKPQLVRIVNEEVLKPGALYRECAVVQQIVPGLPSGDVGGQEKEGTKVKDENGPPEPGFPDDGELGGEEVGRVVWEWYEARLKQWEATTGAADPKPSAGESSKADVVPAS